MSSLTLTLNGVDVTRKLERGVHLYDTINGRGTIDFVLNDLVAGVAPDDGQPVIYYDTDGTTKLWSGIAITPEQTLLGLSHYRWGCQGVDFTYLTDKRIVAAAYENKTLAYIANDLVTNFLDGEGITLGLVDTGPTVSKLIFNYISVTKCLNQIGDLGNCSWWIDVNKQLTFCERDEVIAPVVITGFNAWGFTVTPDRSVYRNRQYLRAGTDLTSSRTDAFKGDGSTRTFTTAFPVGLLPTNINVNGGAAKTIGILGVDTGRQYYWNKGANTIVQDPSETVLSATDVLNVTYQGQFPIIVSAQLDTEIAARAAIEGNSGYYDHVEDDPNINASAAAIAKTNAFLQRYGLIAKRIKFSTFQKGLRAGQLLTLNYPQRNLTGQYLIDEIHGRDVNGQQLEYTVRCLSGDALGGWQRFFRKMSDATAQDVARDNEVLLLARSAADEIYCQDVLGSESGGPESRVDYARIGFAEIA